MSRDGEESISATELAKLGLCEVRLQLDAQYGQGRETREQAKAKTRGKEVHNRALVAAEAHSGERDSRCFIATAIYGPDAPQTQALRSWRDETLRHRRLGPFLIRLYYALSPALARRLGRWPRVAQRMRVILDWMVAMVTRGNR